MEGRERGNKQIRLNRRECRRKSFLRRELYILIIYEVGGEGGWSGPCEVVFVVKVQVGGGREIVKLGRQLPAHIIFVGPGR